MILASVFGALIGNFTTTLFYRIPQNITILGFNAKTNVPPFCPSCCHLLRFYEYLPILSWFSTFGRCNYCGIAVDKTYYILELLNALCSVNLWMIYGFNEEYALLVIACALFILQLALYRKYKFFWNGLLLAYTVDVTLFRVLSEQTVLGVVAAAFYIIVLMIYCEKSVLKIKHIKEFLLIFGIWCSIYALIVVHAMLWLYQNASRQNK